MRTDKEGRGFINILAADQKDLAQRFATRDIDRFAGVRWRVFATHGAERDVQVYVGEQIASRADILWAILHGMLTPILLALPVLVFENVINSGVQPAVGV